MGNKNSRLQEYRQFPGQKPPGPLNRFKGFFIPEQVNSGIPRSGMILPPRTSEFSNLQFILAKPPPIIVQPQQGQQVQTTQKLNAIKAKIIEYNKTWNFGNQPNGQPQSLLKEKTYNEFLEFVTNLIQGGRNTPNQMRATINANARSYQDKQNIVREIHKLVGAGGNQLVNEFFQVKISEIYPNFPGVNKQDDTMMVTLLGLASIFGAEHIVIYLLMIGADPSITKTDNRDSATLMLSFQIGFYKLHQQQQPQFLKYFIVLPRILYILFLLGSIGEGIDLSAIFETNEKKIKKNNSTKPEVPVKSSILNMLAQMPGNTSDETARQTLQNGGSIPLLLEILEKNNPNPLDKPKFFKDVNSLETPYDINVLYSVLMNPNIDDETKIRLTELLVIHYNANITNVPTFVVKDTNISIFDRIILAIYDIKFTNPQTKLDILGIFSASNKEFKDKLIKSGILNNSNNNKTAKIKRLEDEVDLLRKQINLMTSKIDSVTTNLAATGAQSALLSAEIDSLTGNKRMRDQPQNPPIDFGINQLSAQQVQQQYPINPGFSQTGQQQLQYSNRQLQTQPKTSIFGKARNIFSRKPSNQQQLFGTFNPQNKRSGNYKNLFKKLAGGQAGGKQIQMRTYHFLKHKKYSERAFIAERPIIAADNAYDFMKLHYDIGSKKITFTIHDRVNNKKYKYTARTLKDGTNVIKSAK
jgi:hypothetical protein